MYKNEIYLQASLSSSLFPTLFLRDQLKTEVAELKNKVETLESRYDS